jgi:GTPase SAR1 family protein
MADGERYLIAKIITVGDFGVGKTSFTTRFFKDEFTNEWFPIESGIEFVQPQNCFQSFQ